LGCSKNTAGTKKKERPGRHVMMWWYEWRQRRLMRWWRWWRIIIII